MNYVYFTNVKEEKKFILKRNLIIFLFISLFLLVSCSHGIDESDKNKTFFIAHEVFEQPELGRQIFFCRNDNRIQITLDEDESCIGAPKMDHNGSCFAMIGKKTNQKIESFGQLIDVLEFSRLIKITSPAPNQNLSDYKIETLLLAAKPVKIYDLLSNDDKNKISQLSLSPEVNTVIHSSQYPYVISGINYVSPDGDFLILQIMQMTANIYKDGITVDSNKVNAIFFVQSKNLKLIKNSSDSNSLLIDPPEFITINISDEYYPRSD